MEEGEKMKLKTKETLESICLTLIISMKVEPINN